MTTPSLGRIVVPLLAADGQTHEFTSDEPDPGSVSKLPAVGSDDTRLDAVGSDDTRLDAGYGHCPSCGCDSLYGTARLLMPPDGAFCKARPAVLDECASCDYRKVLDDAQTD